VGLRVDRAGLTAREGKSATETIRTRVGSDI
jgi:hypothetical protein